MKPVPTRSACEKVPNYVRKKIITITLSKLEVIRVHPWILICGFKLSARIRDASFVILIKLVVGPGKSFRFK